tara:strand:+ start:4132 stop:4881 length:750 start_codon:yes stop_codon:yes gene_type:complete
MKISIVTVCYNSEDTIHKCIESILTQTYQNIEYIIIDGGSSDATLDIIRSNISENIKIFSEADDGIYDAMNKGFYKATGDVVAYLNSDDYYSSPEVIRSVMLKFNNREVDYVYGDIDYINKALVKVRSWVVGEITTGVLRSQQIPHPAFFCRRYVIDRLSIPFDSSLKICGDLKQQLYLINKHKIRGCYINEVLAIMRIGGASTSGLGASLLGWKEAISVYNEVEGRGGFLYVIRKVLKKVLGLWPRRV